MAAKTREQRLGKQPPRHRFFLNPYSDVRFTICPQCGGKTRQRNLPLVINVEPLNPVALNKTCRYCPACDLLIAHRDELESLLAALFAEHKPEVMGNEYLVIGTLDRADWRRGTQAPSSKGAACGPRGQMPALRAEPEGTPAATGVRPVDRLPD